MSENLAYADGSTPGFLLLSPTSDCLGAISETPLVGLFVVHTCRKVTGTVNMGRGRRICGSKSHLPCGGSMMLMDGQLSHIGFDGRCRPPSALLDADDEDCDEDIG